MAGANKTPERYIEDIAAVTEIFSTLRSRAPDVLKKLRDSPGEDDERAATDWAAQFNLSTPVIEYCAAAQRRWWRLQPVKAQQREVGGGWESPVVCSVTR
jgi:hypothetical protein